MTKPTFFSRMALPILMIVFFLIPFTMRGARVSVQNMRNDVKDWLPSTFRETKEMDWFWKHFLGERFVVMSWDGCNGDDEAYKLFLRKLHPELPPSIVAQRAAAKADEAAAGNGSGNAASLEKLAAAAAGPDRAASGDAGDDAKASDLERGMHAEHLERDHPFIGDRLGLFFSGEDSRNWGGRDEKWIQGRAGLWYFITPDGSLYEWDGAKSPIAAAAAKVWRSIAGGQIDAKRVANFGAEDGAWYYEHPRRLDAQLFRSVTTGPLVLAGMTGEGGVLKDNEEEAHARLKGSLFGQDGKTTALIVTLSDAGRYDLHRSIGRGLMGKPKGRLYTIAAECGISMDELHIGGPTVDNVAIEEEGTRTLVRLVSLCVVLGVGLAYACFRTITATLMVFFIGGISAVMSVALVGWCHVSLDAVLMSMPALVYVLGISGAVHLINYYREAVEEHGFVGAPEAAVSHGWKPALMCNLTTAFGLFSLFTSEIVPIRKFGIFSGIAVLATLILLFTYLPAALQIWPQQPRTVAQKRRDEHPWYDKYLSNFWDWFGGGIIRHHYAVAGICLSLIFVVGWGVTKINTTVNMLKMFDDSAKILKDYAWLETNIGKLVPMEVVVKVPPRLMMATASEREERKESNPDELYQLTFLDRMDIVDRIQRVIEQEFGEQGQGVAGRSLSAVTFSPMLPKLKGDTMSFARRGATNARLESHREEFLRSEYLRTDMQDQSELWRISLRIGALQNVDYGEFVDEIKCAVEPVMAAHRQREAVLREIAKNRDGQLSKARVLLVGAPLGPSKKAKPTKATTKAAAKSAKDDADSDADESQLAQAKAGASKAGADDHVIDQTKIFAQTLRDLLMVARLQVSWYDPSADTAPEDWAATAGAYDCVVLVADHASYGESVLRDKAKLLVDVRDHKFDPKTVDMATVPTAIEPHHDVTAIYTGVVPIVYKAQRTLLNSLIESTFWSFVTITPLMMFVARSIRSGMIAMLPNVLPVFVIFGAMGWMGVNVDIGSMMTASIALGVAVDDTIHYLTWFQQALNSGQDRHAAILTAYKRCATPTFQAALISGLGLSIFAFSTFTPTQRFGYLMLTILFAGVAAELIYFPALLAGPLGSMFKARKGSPAGDGSSPKTHEPPHETPAGPGAKSTTEPTSGGRVDPAHGFASAEMHRAHVDVSAKTRPGI